MVCYNLSYPVFIPKPGTHRMHDPESIVPHIWPKVFTDNQISRIKYDYYYINNVSKDYDTHCMHDPGSVVPHIWPKVFTDNQMSQIKYDYYYKNIVVTDYDDSQRETP
jgi:hypothetical protein